MNEQIFHIYIFECLLYSLPNKSSHCTSSACKQKSTLLQKDRLLMRNHFEHPLRLTLFDSKVLLTVPGEELHTVCPFLFCLTQCSTEGLDHHKLLWSIFVFARHCWPLGLFIFFRIVRMDGLYHRHHLPASQSITNGRDTKIRNLLFGLVWLAEFRISALFILIS